MKQTILYLYKEVMPYNLPVFKVFHQSGYEVSIIQDTNDKLTPFNYSGEEGITIRNLSSFHSYEEFEGATYSPDICLVYMSESFKGWYWRLCRKFRRTMAIPVIVGSDAQWSGNRNNYIKKFLFPLTYRRVFTHIQCAGLWQAVYARKIGFKRDQIVTPMLCADNELYYKVSIRQKESSYPRQFIYVGRLHDGKGIQEILSAWDRIEDKKGWTLTMIGNGPMEQEIRQHPDVVLRPFLSQKEICSVMQESGCALIPSRYDSWGLVIHEAAAGGLPIIVSRCCGATYRFVIDGFNGHIIDGNLYESLLLAMKKIIAESDESLLEMSRRSRQMAQSIIPEHVAYSLMSLIKK